MAAPLPESLPHPAIQVQIATPKANQLNIQAAEAIFKKFTSIQPCSTPRNTFYLTIKHYVLYNRGVVSVCTENTLAYMLASPNAYHTYTAVLDQLRSPTCADGQVIHALSLQLMSNKRQGSLYPQGVKYNYHYVAFTLPHAILG